MYQFVTVLIILVSILLIMIVLVQNSKGGGLANNFAGSNQVMGVKKTTDFLEKATWTLASSLVILAFVSVMVLPREVRQSGSAIDEELENIRTAVFEREAIMSTGVGKGLAIPHGKVKNLARTLASFAILQNPIDYKAIDDVPVNMVFLMVAPEAQNSVHIKLLSRISRMLNNQDFRDRLEQAGDKDKIVEVFQEEESAHFGVE